MQIKYIPLLRTSNYLKFGKDNEPQKLSNKR